MKLSTTLAAAVIAANTTSAFDKWLPWGKRDYPCVNVYQGIPENATVAPGAKISVRFNRAPTTHCSDPLSKYPGSAYNVWLYNNPVRDRDTISYDASVKVAENIAESDGAVTITIPEDLNDVDDDTLWYLRVGSSLPTAPQMPSIFYPAGPFTITA